jgi:hypothetical protein
VEKPDRSMCRPIHKAVADADDECVRILLEAGARPTVADDVAANRFTTYFSLLTIASKVLRLSLHMVQTSMPATIASVWHCIGQ